MVDDLTAERQKIIAEKMKKQKKSQPKKEVVVPPKTRAKLIELQEDIQLKTKHFGDLVEACAEANGLVGKIGIANDLSMINGDGLDNNA